MTNDLLLACMYCIWILKIKTHVMSKTQQIRTTIHKLAKHYIYTAIILTTTKTEYVQG